MDKLTPKKRSENMSRIRSTDMRPEKVVRSIIHRMGFRFRLHARELPGKPDIVRRSKMQAIFVHGCFWHQHPKKACLDARLPKSNTDYWHAKLAKNVERDKRSIAALRRSGWRVLVIWECETKDTAKLLHKLTAFLCTDRNALFAERRNRADFAAFDNIMRRKGGEKPRKGDEIA